MEDSSIHKYKIMIIGESSIGKTSMISRYTSNTFKLEYLSTIGIDFQVKNLTLNGKNIKLQIWDTAGQERYKNITKSYFQSSNGFIIAYDISKRQTFDCISNWMDTISELASIESQKILVGTKCDIEEREVTYEEGENLAKEYNIKFYETSAKDNINIEDTFVTLTLSILEEEERGNINNRQSIVIDRESTVVAEDIKQKKNCC